MEIPKCPKCGGGMKLIDGKKGPFYGCTRYKETGCDGIVSVPKSDGVRIAEALDRVVAAIEKLAIKFSLGKDEDIQF